MNFVFDVALGKVALYAEMVNAGTPAACGLIVVPIEGTGKVDDTTMRRYPTLAALLAGPTNENTQASIGRKKILEGLDISINQTTSAITIKAPDVTWAAGTGGNPIACFVWCYVPDEAVVNDNLAIPLTKHDRLWTPDGTPFILSGPNGLYQATATAAAA